MADVFNVLEVEEPAREMAGDLVVDESHLSPEDLFIVVEEPETLPGTDKVVNDVKEMDAKDQVTTWVNDKDHAKFMEYLEDKLTKIPKHSGNTIVGCERAISYLKSLLSEATSAMRSDYDAKIDESKLDKLCEKIENMVERLETQVGGLKKGANVQMYSDGFCKECNANAPVWHDLVNQKMVCMGCAKESGEVLSKTASTPVMRVYMTPFERAIVGTIINASVSAGRNMEEVYAKLKDKYSFTPREELAIQQLIADHGYPVFKDRGLLNEPSDPASGDTIDWSTSYYA